MVQQLADVVNGKAWRPAEVVRLHDELAFLAWFGTAEEAEPQQVVHGCLQRLSRAAHLFVDFGLDVIVQGQSSSHISMLYD